MDQIIMVGLTLISLLLGGAVSLFVQRQGRQEKLKISEADCRVYASVEIPEELTSEHELPVSAGVGIDLIADLVNKCSHPATVRRWSWLITDEHRIVRRPLDSKVCLVKLGEQEFDPPKKLIKGPLGTAFIVGVGEVAVLTFGGIFPGASYKGLDIGTSRLCVRYWGSERAYEWEVGEEEMSWRDVVDLVKVLVPIDNPRRSHRGAVHQEGVVQEEPVVRRQRKA
jgi:hypothetical protein